MEQENGIENSSCYSGVQILHRGLQRSVEKEDYLKANYIHYVKRTHYSVEEAEEDDDQIDPMLLYEENEKMKVKIFELKKENKKLQNQIQQEHRIEKFFNKKVNHQSPEDISKNKLFQIILALNIFNLEKVLQEKEEKLRQLKDKRQIQQQKQIFQFILESARMKVGTFLLSDQQISQFFQQKQAVIKELKQKIKDENKNLQIKKRNSLNLKQKIELTNMEINRKSEEINEKKKYKMIDSNLSIQAFEQINCKFKNDEDILKEMVEIQKESRQATEQLNDLMEAKIREKLKLYHEINNVKLSIQLLKKKM